ncbi:hypothetical protein [Acidovorax sp. SUPP3334]|nr:hypothetical protein [Acidovorax sp. SUPP3334]GKT26492.1 hypothetical protein AVHM3334_21160 [Acidovorax sp. SUPP3334]
MGFHHRAEPLPGVVRSRYVTDNEFGGVRANAPPPVIDAMGIALLTG